MSEITAVVEQQDEFSVSTTEGGTVSISSNISNPAVVESLDFVGDVDMTTNGKVNGSVLVYKTTTNKWTSTTTLDAQNMEGGEF